jgi:hypothetical protein
MELNPSVSRWQTTEPSFSLSEREVTNEQEEEARMNHEIMT